MRAPLCACAVAVAGDGRWGKAAVPARGCLCACGTCELRHALAARTDPILAYTADSEINQLQWSKAHNDWCAIAYANKMQILRV